jgi:hypothetical protein
MAAVDEGQSHLHKWYRKTNSNLNPCFLTSACRLEVEEVEEVSEGMPVQSA